MATPELTAGAEPRLRAERRRIGEDVVKGALALCALVSVATTIGIVVALFVPAFEFFREISIVDVLTGTNWSPLFEPASFGVVPLVAGTLLVTAIASLVAMPLGLGAAVYMSEYASPRARGIIKPAFELYGETGSIHCFGLRKWGGSELTIRKRVFPSGRPEWRRWRTLATPTSRSPKACVRLPRTR